MRRTWLFVPGADEAAHAAAARSGADVIVLELEDFTPPQMRERARELSGRAFERWRKAGALAGVRVNPFETCGAEDLAGIARPDILMMSKVDSPQQVRRLEEAAPANIELVPNVESAAGLLRTAEIARASPRVVALLVASEDMVADLGTERSRAGEELAYVRARFLLECRAARVEAIDCPYTFSDVKGAVADARYAKRLGYRMKSLVDPAHARAINAVFTPSIADLAKARRIVVAFDKARAMGKDRAKVDGALIEVPIYAAAKRLLASAGNTPPQRRKKRR
ncbi:MAG TPA: CoA ester lyase [Burkholderiales bacterium]|nr:CoA ester lyase [Burkholderiales bacterium]